MNELERRGAQRLLLNMPAVVCGTNSKGQKFYEVTSTINVSSSGVYFPLNQFIDQDSELEVWIIQLATGVNARFKARARVVRREAIARRELSGTTLPATHVAVQFLESLSLHQSSAA